jgi:hypothetical protein
MNIKMSETEQKFQKMYWKKVHEYNKLLQKYNDLKPAPKLIGTLKFVNLDKHYGIMYTDTIPNTLYFNQNSSNIDLNNLHKNDKVIYELIEPTDKRFKTQSHILEVIEPAHSILDYFPEHNLEPIVEQVVEPVVEHSWFKKSLETSITTIGLETMINNNKCHYCSKYFMKQSTRDKHHLEMHIKKNHIIKEKWIIKDPTIITLDYMIIHWRRS